MSLVFPPQLRPPIFPRVPCSTSAFLSFMGGRSWLASGWGSTFSTHPSTGGPLGSLRVLLLMQHQVEELETKPGSAGSPTQRGSH